MSQHKPRKSPNLLVVVGLMVGLFWLLAQNGERTAFAEAHLKDGANSPKVGWIRAGVNTNTAIWGLPSGLQFALHPAGFTEGQGGPRGLIRIGYPILPDGSVDLINFIAVEPIVHGRRGLSELEESSVDRKTGKYFWVGKTEKPTAGAVPLDPGIIHLLADGVEELRLTVHLERFENGAHVQLRLSQRTDSPGELRLAVEAEPDSAPIETCILTATMGNKARARLLLLKDGPVSSLQLYPDYRDKDFAPHKTFGVERLPRMANGDVMVAIANDEPWPATVQPFGRPGFWDYRGSKVTQYWRKSSREVQPDLSCAVNGRFTYWGSRQPIPGGVAFENFELRESFRSGQSYIFGISSRPPEIITSP
ncbi:MAG: hypothetical protein JWM16_4887 [Verrucomicrobiales bacterium]|nr:hypothetical protein [Verrucomicrobiales bacterium]